VFQTVRLGIESDVKERNRRLPVGYNPFETKYDGQHLLVFRHNPRAEKQDILRFTATESGIRVVDDVAGVVTLEAHLTLNDKGECRLKVNGAECAFWQFRRRALEAMMFDSVPSVSDPEAGAHQKGSVSA
jgi:hypothetical protein